MRKTAERTVSAAEANRRFSELLRRVREGSRFVVTSHGKPVARIMPVTRVERTALRARHALLTRLRAQRTTDIGRWSRDALYERGR